MKKHAKIFSQVALLIFLVAKFQFILNSVEVLVNKIGKSDWKIKTAEHTR